MTRFSKTLVFSACIFIGVNGLELPGSCQPGQFYDPGTLTCQTCSGNVSMVPSSDGFSCTCQELSIPSGVSRCRPCNSTEVVSADGRSCVPRRCQSGGGRFVCRKCPADYISVTQNFDGTPMKEVQCVKCARGYKAVNNACVRCESCSCNKQDIVVRGRCVPKRFMNERPKHDDTKLHPFELLDIVKEEYFCTQNDLLACRRLADACVKNFYSSDLAGPCRLWVQPKAPQVKGLPQLTIETTLHDKDPTEIALTRGMDTLHLVSAVYTSGGGIQFNYNPDKNSPCFLPLKIKIGKDYAQDCRFNISQLESSLNETLAPFLLVHGDLRALPISLLKTNGYKVQRETWINSKFRRYFLLANSLSITVNMTNAVYLRTLLIKVRIERNKSMSTTLRVHVCMEAQYATKSPLSDTITTTLRVEHEMPSAGVLKGLEIWGGVLGAFLALYAVIQWRGTMRRGGLHFSLVPILAASVADTLYFAALFSSLHALAAEAGTLGMTLPLSHSEEYMIKAFIYSAVSLKAVKVAWVNWNQCKCDMFFLDWSEYHSPLKDLSSFDKTDSWRATTLAREWSRMQTIRRATPVYTVTLALIILHLLAPWQAYLPQSQSYRWAVATLAWWAAYSAVLAARWVVDRIRGPPTAVLPRVCRSVGLSLLVFQEEYYAHYVHGRNDESDARSLVGPLSACRVVCSPQLRAVYKQLSPPGLVALGEKDSRMSLLSKFLAAFFERALDGLSWVANERTVPERLLDVEIVARESGNTSVLLYDPVDAPPSCFNVTWWGEEWTLGTFDAILFGAAFVVTANTLLAALVTLITWQIMKFLRSLFGNQNQTQKTVVDIDFTI